jgi:hypothetical protein
MDPGLRSVSPDAGDVTSRPAIDAGAEEPVVVHLIDIPELYFDRIVLGGVGIIIPGITAPVPGRVAP